MDNSKSEIILNAIENKIGLSREEIKSRKQDTKYVYARRIYCVICRDVTFFSLSEIGKFIERDHATVLNCLRKHAKDIGRFIDYKPIYESVLDEYNVLVDSDLLKYRLKELWSKKFEIEKEIIIIEDKLINNPCKPDSQRKSEQEPT